MPPGDYAIQASNADFFPGNETHWENQPDEMTANWESAWIDIGGEG